ncbi:MAG: hypothetical protein RL007_553 [Bacteroidota bacterium]|jgi:hypothetical protein
MAKKTSKHSTKFPKSKHKLDSGGLKEVKAKHRETTLIKEKQLFTYNDWWTGKVHLVWSTCVFNKDQPVVPGVDWDRFRKADIPKIRNKQRELFNDALKKLTAVWKKKFTSAMKGSQLKDVLLKRELQLFYDVMFRQFPDAERVTIGHKRLMFRWQDLANIQNWIRSVIVNGDKISYDFVHSPKCRYRDLNKVPDEIYAHACWDYYNWLKTYLQKPDKDHMKNNNEEPVRYNNFVFQSAKAEQIFNDYCNSYSEELKKTPMALLSFVYWQMKTDRLINALTPTQFRDFLSTLPANYELEKLKTFDKCKSPDKVKVYEICKAKHSA